MDNLASDLARQQSGIDKTRDAEFQQTVDLQKQQAQNAKAKEAALVEPGKEAMDASKSLGALADHPLPASEAAKLNFEPHKVDPKEVEKFSWALVALTALGGAVSRGNWLGVSSALNGAMKGFIEGDHAKAQKELEDFQRKFDTAEKHDKEGLDRLAAVRDNRKMSLNAKLQQYQLIAAEYDLKDVATATQLKQHDTVMQQLNSRENSLTRARAQLEAAGLGESQGGFGGDTGKLMAALAERGVSLPAGFRSKAQQQAMLHGLLERNPNMNADEIADKIKSGQIEFGADKKETTTAAGVAGRVAVAQNEIKQFAPIVLQASDAVPRGQFVPITKLLQSGEASISDPNLKRLRISINSLLNAYDMLAARGGTDKHKREEAHSMLTSADSPEALKAGIGMFLQEADAAERAAQQAMQPPGQTPAAPAAAGWKVEKVQ